MPRKAAPALPVIVEPVAFAAESLALEAIGTSRALRSVVLYPESAGVVESVSMQSGQRVKKGEVLLTLEARDEDLALRLAEVRLRDARKLAKRYKPGTSAVPLNDVEAAQLALATAEIEVERARVALADRVLRAPFAGVVGMTEIDPGDRVDPSTAITTIDDRTSLLVSFEVPELMFDAVRKGERVEIGSWSQRGPGVLGEVVDVGTRIDPVTRTVPARARVANDDDHLRPGMSFRVGLQIDGGRYPAVPEVAVQWGANGAYVWTLVEGKARKVAADIVQRRDGRVLVDGDISADAQVIVEGIQSVREGREVIISRFQP